MLVVKYFKVLPCSTRNSEYIVWISREYETAGRYNYLTSSYGYNNSQITKNMESP